MSHGERDIRETLGGFYQELHQRWKKAEELLLSFRVPASVSVRIKTVQPAAEEKPFLSACHHDLGFVKHYGRWGICYGLSSDGTPGSLYWMSIHHCSAEQQVEAAACFPALLSEVTRAAEQYTHTVQAAMSFLQGALPGLSAESPLPPAAAAPPEPTVTAGPEAVVAPTPMISEEPAIQAAEPEPVSEPLADQSVPVAAEEEPETVKVEPPVEALAETLEERKEAA